MVTEGRTTAVTGPPPKDYDLNSDIVGGPGSRLCSLSGLRRRRGLESLFEYLNPRLILVLASCDRDRRYCSSLSDYKESHLSDIRTKIVSDRHTSSTCGGLARSHPESNWQVFQDRHNPSIGWIRVAIGRDALIIRGNSDRIHRFGPHGPFVNPPVQPVEISNSNKVRPALAWWFGVLVYS